MFSSKVLLLLFLSGMVSFMTSTETTTASETAADKKFVCAEISYASGNYGPYDCDVHSDICPPGHNKDGLNDANYREFLHECLDEWLNKANGSGYFFIGDPDEWQRSDDDF
jgi:hypothetical protein